MKPQGARWAVLFLLVASMAGAQQPPRFTSTVEVTSIDVGVVDGSGQPLATLKAEDFTVRIDGDSRRVVSAEWVSNGAASPEKPRPVVPAGFSSNDNMGGGRLLVLAIDQPNLRAGDMLAVKGATDGFIDKLTEADRMTIVGFGTSGRATPFTGDRAVLKLAIARMTGDQRPTGFLGSYNIAISEAVSMIRGDIAVRDAVVSRECAGSRRNTTAFLVCTQQIDAEATLMVQEANQANDQTIRALRDLLISLKAIEGPKTLVLVSNGFVLDDSAPLLTELGTLAAAGRTSLYALQLDDNGGGDVGSSRRPTAPIDDLRGRRAGLELLTAASRGTIFSIVGGGVSAFERVRVETSGYYLLGVESQPSDRDGKPHPIRVDVTQRGAVVRSRRQILNSAAETIARSARQAVAIGLTSPLLLSALPLRVATFSLQGPEKDRVQLLIHAEVGADYSASRPVSVGYVIIDASGRTVETRGIDSRLDPVMNGVPSALQFTAGASLVPGNYTLKIVAAEGDRAGSVEHPVHAALVDGGTVRLSELMVGGPSDTRNLMKPTIGHTVSFGLLHPYVEAYGPLAEAVTVKYEIAATADGPALLSADAPGELAGDERMIFTRSIPVNALPPGQYVVRAGISSAARPVKTLTRPFEVAPPAVLMTSAEGTGSTIADSDLFLPVDDQAFTRAFRRDEAVSAEVLKPFRERVPTAVKNDFEAGVTSLGTGDYGKAEASLKRAIQPDVDSTIPMAYLAATFAAGGRDADAAAAWQTALVDGSELPQVYDWLSQALLRTHSLTEARAILEEAVGKWPADARFTGPLAMLYAIFGKGLEAVRTLTRYLDIKRDDREAYRLGVEWIYQAHLSGRPVQSRDADLQLAHTWADAYQQLEGPQVPLVRQWIDFLDHESR